MGTTDWLASSPNDPAIPSARDTARAKKKPRKPRRDLLGQRSVARTDKDGRYVAFTDKDQEGASVGVHRVSLYDPLAIPASEGLLTAREMKATPPSRVPKAYTNVSKTPLQPVEVGHDAQTYDIHLKSK